MSVTSFFHCVNSGDLIASMAGLRNHHIRTGSKCLVYQKTNHFASYYPNATHPVRDENGTMVTLNDNMLKMIKPLVVSQSYVEDLIKWSGEQAVVDLHRIHAGVFVNMPKGSIQRWTWYAFPDLAIGASLCEPWIEVEDNPDIKIGINGKGDRELKDCIILNFTERYRNHAINYFFLKPYENRLIFAGTEEEHRQFTKRWSLNIPRLIVNDFLELAQALKMSKGFLGNQSMCYNIAEAMKIPRILEICDFAPNCIIYQSVKRELAADFLYEGAAAFYVEEMLKDKFPVSNTTMTCPVCESLVPSAGNKHGTDYFKCGACGTLFSKQLPQENMLGGLHEDETEERTKQNNIRTGRIGFNLKSHTFLDYGCGNGELVKAGNEAGLQAFGYDKFATDDYKEMPSGPFDCVTMIEVAEHLSWPYEEFDDIKKLLKPSGVLYIETSFADWVNIEDEYCDPVKGHSTIFSHKSLRQLLDKKGFEYRGLFDRNSLIFSVKANDEVVAPTIERYTLKEENATQPKR